jgi:hypothetical protein
MLRPEILQCQNQTLKGLDVWRGVIGCLVCHDDCLLVSLCVAPRFHGTLRKFKTRIIRWLALLF